LKKLTLIGGVAGLALIALLASRGRAADHADSPTLASNPMADITDVYAWMTGTNLNLVMDISPLDDRTHSFGPSVLYVFHVTSKPGLGVGAAGGTETKIICRFASNTSVQCWVTNASGTVTKDYVTGDPRAEIGITSVLGKAKVFAGRRSDPSSFNVAGLTGAVMTLNGLAPTLDATGCPALTAAQAGTIRTTLATGTDAFAGRNVMALVVQVERSLVVSGSNSTVAVWGATHAGS
jgi:Domain of unknown function (DUF4331)